MCFVGTDRKFSISFWWETVWLLNFALSWHVSKRLGSSATPSGCFSGLEEAWQAWHPRPLLQSGTRTVDSALGQPASYHSSAAVQTPHTPDCFTISGFSTQLHLSPAPQGKWWILALTEGDGSLPESLAQRSRGLVHWPDSEILQHYYRNYISRTFFDPKFFKSSLYICLKSWERNVQSKNPVEIHDSELHPKSLPRKLMLHSQWQKSSRIWSTDESREKERTFSVITSTTLGYNFKSIF